MGEAAISRLNEASEDLIRALDSGSAADIEAATVRFGAAIDGVRTVTTWRENPALVEQLHKTLALAESARSRVNYLTDLARRRFELLCRSAGIAPRQTGYDRHARLRV